MKIKKEKNNKTHPKKNINSIILNVELFFFSFSKSNKIKNVSRNEKYR